MKRMLDDESAFAVINCLHLGDVARVTPDLLVTDFRSISAIPLDNLLQNGTKLLLLEVFGMTKMDERSILPFLSKGLVGILKPSTDVDAFKKAVAGVCSGELWIERKKLKEMIADNRNSNGSSLTEKEVEIIKMVCKGYRNKEIMRTLNVSEQAVKSHLHRIFRKIGVSDRLQLALYAMRHYPRYLGD